MAARTFCSAWIIPEAPATSADQNLGGMAPRIVASLVTCVVFGTNIPARAGVVAEETTVIDFLQLITMDIRAITSVEGKKARLDLTVRIKEGPSSPTHDESMHSEIQRLDRGVVYNVFEPARQFRERKLGSPVTATDSSPQIAAIASGLQCEWTTAVVAKTKIGREIIGGATAAHVRIDASRRCVPFAPSGSSCTLAITYHQWSTRPNELHAQLARYRRMYATKTGTATGIAEAFLVFSQFGVPVDPVLLESIRTAVVSEGQAVKSNAILRGSRSCFTQAGGASDAATATSTQPAQSYPAFLLQYVGAMMLSAWVTERDAQSEDGSADKVETLGIIATELKSIRAQKFRVSQFEVPAGFTQGL